MLQVEPTVDCKPMASGNDEKRLAAFKATLNDLEKEAHALLRSMLWASYGNESALDFEAKDDEVSDRIALLLIEQLHKSGIGFCYV